MPTNFELAPPPVVTGGVTAVPVDFQTVTAGVTFDMSGSSAAGDATVTFQTGASAGRPVFDLRQAITGVWLDGAPLPVSSVLTRDLGGGPGAELKVLDAALAAGSTHTLRLTYSIGLPASPPGGGYPPGLTYGAGGRLSWNFGFTDLAPARYLESWVPANLIWDQFALTLTVRLTGTSVAHALITNGTSAALGANHWKVTFPASSTAMSPLLELQPRDQLFTAATTVTLPVSGSAVTVEGWKRAANTAIDVPVQVANIAAWLSENELQIGAYAHGNRFVTYLQQGGMEYDGGCTSSPGALRHETYHSWWGRALRPASQADGWVDEGWNTYHDAGGAGAVPLDYSAAPVTLCGRNLYSRVTPSASYVSGSALFSGLAALSSPAALAGWMRQFYANSKAKPFTTVQLESHLLARSGKTDTVDAFHRFVYGFADSVPGPDLWIRDDPGQSAEQWAGRFWDSPDVWIRRADDDGTTHQSPVAGQDNWFYARVHNRGRGLARHFMVTFQVRPFAGVQFRWPADFLPATTASGGFDLRPGASAVVKARWPAAQVPAGNTHACVLAAVLARGDVPDAGAHVWEHGNLAQKNLTVLRLAPGDVAAVPFVALSRGAKVVLRVVTPPGLAGIRTELLRRGPVAEVPGILREIMAGTDSPSGYGLEERPTQGGEEADTPLDMDSTGSVGLDLPLGTALFTLRMRVPDSMSAGSSGVIDVVQQDQHGRAFGGISVAVEVGK
jgi:hypothetical protein